MKRLNRKGFTLIELLAVIVVLAIILVITVPMILNTLSSTRQDALQASANSVAKFYEDQIRLAALGKQDTGFIVDIVFRKTGKPCGPNGFIDPPDGCDTIGTGTRNITVEEAAILELNTVDYKINPSCTNSIMQNVDNACFFGNYLDYSTVTWTDTGKVTVTLKGNSSGGKFKGLTANSD